MAEVFTPRPSSSSSKDLSSVECFSTHSGQEREASSRLAARLERSEFKRSRGKQRLSQRSSPSGQSTPRGKHGREHGATVVTRRQGGGRGDAPSLKSRHHKVQDTPSHSRPSSWCEPTRNEEVLRERPKSFHGGDLETERPGMDFSLDPHRRSRHSRGSYPIANDYSEMHDGEVGDQGDSKGEQYLPRSRSSSFSSHIGSSADEQDDSHGVYSAYDMTGRSPYGSVVSRRYSQSSLSSSSASWQPSSASLGHQVVKVFKESGTLLSSLPDESRETSGSYFSPQVMTPGHLEARETVYDVRGIPQDRPENTEPSFISRFTIHPDENIKHRHISEQRYTDSKSPAYSSRPVSNLEKSSAESTLVAKVTLRSKDDKQRRAPSRVKDLAKRFSGTFSSLEQSQNGFSRMDTRIVKAETWPKFAYVPTNSDQYSGDEDSVPPKPPYPPSLFEHVLPRGAEEGAPPKPPLPLNSSDWGLPNTTPRSIRYVEGEVMHRKVSDSRESKTAVASVEMFVNAKPERQSSLSSREASRSDSSSYGELKNSEAMVSQLIKLHENRIALHAKSATSHLQIHLKRPAPECGPWWKSPEWSPDSTQMAEDKEQVYRYVDSLENADGTAQSKEPFTGEGNRMRVCELTEHDRVNPIKVVDVTDKNDQSVERQTIKERPRVKRHRTIGVVGYRQQTDRATETKPKRHTAIGIVTVKPSALNEDPAARSAHEEHTGKGLFEAISSPVKLGLDEKDSETFEDSVFVEPIGKDYNRDLRLFSKDVSRVPSNFHNDANTEPEQSVPLGVSSRDVGPDRVDDSEQVLEPTVAAFVQSTKEDETRPVIDVEVQESNSVPCKELRKPRLHFSNRTYHHSKTVPVAQVSPVSPSAPEDRKTAQVVSPLQTNHSAREMYETRLALWNLIPSTSTQQSYELQSPEAVCTDSSAKQTPELTVTNASEVDTKPRPLIANNDGALDAPSQEQYESIIERLKKEKQDVIEKHESDKREWRRKYEEQKKVANAYQKLEDRYRRRVHELQEALANCTCHNSFPMADNTRNKSDKEAKSTISSVKGLLIAEELQDWQDRERSKNVKKGNNTTSGDSLISSSSDMTGLAWDEVYDVMLRNGEFDHVNGTDV